MRGLIASCFAAALVGSWAISVFGASVDADTPQRVGARDKTLGANAWDTLIVTDYNGISIDWSAVPTIYFEGLGVGENTSWGRVGRDTLTSATLTALNATGWDFAGYDIDTLFVGAPAAGMSFIVFFEDW